MFARIKRHIENGRWSVVNGWWVQPDVNLPTEEALKRSIQIGHQWFRQHLGITAIPVAYNVDSFGHGAYLPRILREMGQTYYVMMRPEKHEKTLPACLFRWQSPDNHEVLTWRIPFCYLKKDIHVLDRTLQQLISQRKTGTDNLMCFYGVGDHGGGPTREIVNWVLKHQEYAPGVRLEFSSPERFFRLVNKKNQALPIVRDELQMHAIGCYSVCGKLKRAIRKAENSAIQAEALDRHLSHPDATLSAKLNQAWLPICFNQFHDILPGSAVLSAQTTAMAQIGEAQSQIDRSLHLLLRKHSQFNQKSQLSGHLIHVVNPLDRPWSGLISGEIWTDWAPWEHHLQDEGGQPVPCQAIAPESLILEAEQAAIPRLVFPVSLAPFEHQAFKIVAEKREETVPCAKGSPSFLNNQLKNNRLCVKLGTDGIEAIHCLSTDRAMLAEPLSWACHEDLSDTWGHGLKTFSGPVLHAAKFNAAPVVLEQGPLLLRMRLDGKLNHTPLALFVELRYNDPTLYLRLQINYQEPLTVFKLKIAPFGGICSARHLVSGGWLSRTPGPNEVPVNHAVLTSGPNGRLGVVLPDTFAASITPDSIRPTLIRNNIYALHKTSGLADIRSADLLKGKQGTDEGPQNLRLALTCQPQEKDLNNLLDHYQFPVYFWDDYRDSDRLAYFN